MKKVILYYPKLTGDEDSQPLYRGLPLSVLTLAAQFDEKDYQITVIDGRLENSIYKCDLTNLLDNECICVGVSAITSYQIMDGLNFSRQVKEQNPNIPVVWGGWHPSLMPEQTIGSDFVDIIVTGQGETTFPQLVERLAQKGSLRDIHNLTYKDLRKNIVTTGSYFLKEIKTVKSIEHSYQYINMENYIQALWGNKRVIGYESSRGCPWNCKFCSIGSVYNRRWNALTAEQTLDGVKYLYEKYSIDAVHFYDNNFFVDEKRAGEFSRLMTAENLPVRWDGTAVVEQFANFSDEYIEKIKKSGFYRAIVGVESGDEDVLEKINKRHRNHQVLQLVEKCKRHNIMASMSFMVGFPWNPEKDFEETIELIEKIKAIDSNTEILLFIFSPYLGTPLYDVALAYGMTFPDSLEGWSRYTYERSNTPWISDKLLRKINRYISFFGTKDISPDLVSFLQGGKNDKTAP